MRGCRNLNPSDFSSVLPTRVGWTGGPRQTHCLLSPYTFSAVWESLCWLSRLPFHTHPGPWGSSGMLAVLLASTSFLCPLLAKAMSDLTRLPGWGPAHWHPGK